MNLRVFYLYKTVGFGWLHYFESPFIQLAVHSKAGNVVLLLIVPLLFISFGVSVLILALVKIHPGFNDELDVVC